MLPFKKEKINPAAGVKKRILIKINVVGSAGPIRCVVNEDTAVAAVIETALKSYARETRLPVLGTKCDDFFLYTPVAQTQALKPWEMIGSFGVRNFLLCKKARDREVTEITRRKISCSNRWKTCFNKLLTPL
ncbi:hypothetical protein QVD17_03475 [Tagetes erecta]|uniref:DUF7054 domain-containing protein n=1 Tax=Tagetes erecta TaxID=13708 RepID=A0AAD8LBC9_TARER|nr:hypothetical protein QVD17_03475 [Tagetes erecta]